MASKLGKALGFSMDMGEAPKEKSMGIGDSDVDASLEGDGSDEMAPMSSDMSVKDPKDNAPSMETRAMRMFEKAATPEAKVSAFKDLLEACGCTPGGGADY